MLPSTTSQAVVDFPSSGVSPSAMTAEAMAHDEDSFVDLYKGALAVTPPPSSNAKSPQMQWGTALPFAGNAEDDDRIATPAPASGSIEFGGSGANPSSPLPPSSAPPTTLQTNKQSLLPASSSSVAVSAVTATPTPVPPPPTARPPSAATAATPRTAKPCSGPTKARAKGGARQPRRVKLHDDGDDDDDPEDGAPDHRVCLLAVGTKKQRLHGADGTVTVAGGGGGGGGGAMDCGASLDDVIGMLTAEINRNGREAETERVETGERAVLQVRALARSELRYGIVLLEVEGSRAAAIATARELNFSSDVRYSPPPPPPPPRTPPPPTPIIAVAYPHAMLTPAQLLSSEGWRDFNEILPFPVSAATVRGLATRYLLAPPGVAAAAASSGMAGEPISSGPFTAAAATFGQLGRHTAGSGSCCGGTLVPSLPVAGGSGEVPPPPPPQQQQLQQQQEQGTGEALSPHGVAWSVLPDAEEGVLLPSLPLLSVTGPCARRALEGLARPRAAMPSPSLSSPTTVEETLASLKRRVFGGSEEDRALSCGLFGEEFEMKNAEIEDSREYDFVFRHGTILVRVEEGVDGEVVPMVGLLC
ncbi:unnamed protein product, partial [Ectocarpus sp. 12 AP-2014]